MFRRKVDAINCLRGGWAGCVHEAQDLYQYRSPIYDIAVGVFRTIVVGSLAKAISVTLDESIAFLYRRDVVLPEMVTAGCLLLRVAVVVVISFIGYLEISSLIRWSKVNKICKDQSKKDVVLICKATADISGAVNQLSGKALQNFKNFAQAHSIVLKQVSTVADINDAINVIYQQHRRIRTLFLIAHGNSSEILLSRKEEIIGDEPIFPCITRTCIMKIDFWKLDPKADIVLQSCNAGGKSEIVGDLNIAEQFQYYAGRNRRIFAPKAVTNSWELNQTVTSNGEFDYQFTSLLGTDITSDISYSQVFEKLNRKIDLVMSA